MASQLDKLIQRPGEKFPWDTWLNGNVWHLVQGQDFKSPVRYMKRAAHYAAARRGIDVRTSERADGLVLQSQRD